MPVPNQRIVKVHRDMPGEKEGNFLLIKKSNLYEAYRTLNATALCLYLFLAGNKDGYNMEYSPKAIHAEMGMPESTCRDQLWQSVCGSHGGGLDGLFPSGFPQRRRCIFLSLGDHGCSDG